MGKTIRVSLSGYNALTDTDIDHYSLYADSDNILIKEKTRGSVSVANGSTETISHGLSYVPFVMAYVQIDSSRYWLYGFNIYFDYNIKIDATNLYLINDSSTTRTFNYYIFYDQQV